MRVGMSCHRQSHMCDAGMMAKHVLHMALTSALQRD